MMEAMTASLVYLLGGVLIPVGALVSTLSAANANSLGSSEIMVRLAAQRPVPTLAGLWHGHPPSASCWERPRRS